MTDKLWYKKINEEDAYISKTLQEYIDLYFFDSVEFKAVEDITLENLGEFLEVMLKHYQQYHFHLGELYDTGEILEEYFDYVFMDDEKYINYPKYSKEDRRNLGWLLIVNYIQMCNPRLFPEDVTHLIEFLHAKDGEVTKAQEKLNTYLAQFDLMKRQDEDYRCWEAITKERQQAIAENKPLPIRPMSIELSKCLQD